MAKKNRTRVMLPGGIQGLVKDLQNGTSNYKKQPIDYEQALADGADDELEKVDESEAKEKLARENATDQQSQQKVEPAVQPEVTPVDNAQSSRQAAKAVETNEPAAKPEAKQTVLVAEGDGEEKLMREYRITKDNSQDSWDLFLDMALQYKGGDGKLATIYIDETLKNVLDRLKYAGPDKLSTSAILSSIVARFIYDHEEAIRKVLYSGDLI